MRFSRIFDLIILKRKNMNILGIILFTIVSAIITIVVTATNFYKKWIN